jgi:hypothetical protein
VFVKLGEAMTPVERLLCGVTPVERLLCGAAFGVCFASLRFFLPKLDLLFCKNSASFSRMSQISCKKLF